VNHAVADEGVIIRARVELRIGTVAVQRTLQSCRNFAAYFQFHIHFATHGSLIAAHMRMRDARFNCNAVHGSALRRVAT